MDLPIIGKPASLNKPIPKLDAPELPILKKPDVPVQEDPLDFFQDFASQLHNDYEATAPFFGTDEAKEQVLNDIASLCLQFVVARVFRYQKLQGNPRSIRFKIEVEVEGDESGPDMALGGTLV